MTESEYLTLAEATQRCIEEALEAADLDFETGAGGVLEIEFGNGSVIVVNRQTAAQEIWVAARSGGFHYRWNGAEWRDTRSGAELLCELSRLASMQAGTPVTLTCARTPG